MEFPDAAAVDPFLDSVAYPPFARITQSPSTPTLDSVTDATVDAIQPIIDALPTNSAVAVGVGSRQIDAIDTITTAVVACLIDAGHSPVIVPAMGSHGGASADGQLTVLADLGITEARVGCPIDARMATRQIASDPFSVTVAESFLAVDAAIPINRIKPHTGFSGRVESGLCKMLVLGFGKHPGAQQFHHQATVHGFESVLFAAMEALMSETYVPGGIGIVENFVESVAHVEPVMADTFVETEASLLETARELRATFPVNEIDLLVVDQIGKDIAGTGMDTSLIGRTDRTYGEPTHDAAIERIVVRGVTDESHGNINGVGFADVIHHDVITACDLHATYANVLTSGGLRNGALPVVMPTDESALGAAVRSLGAIEQETLRIVWVQDTAQLATCRISDPLMTEIDDATTTVEGYDRLTFTNGAAHFEPLRED